MCLVFFKLYLLAVLWNAWVCRILNYVILDPNGMTFDAVGVFGLPFWLLFKSGSSYCEQGNVLPGKWSRRWANSLSLVTNFLLQLSHSYFNTPWWVSRWFLNVACSLYRLLQILHSRGNILCFSRQWLWKELKVPKEASQSMAQSHLYVVVLYLLFVFLNQICGILAIF